MTSPKDGQMCECQASWEAGGGQVRVGDPRVGGGLSQDSAKQPQGVDSSFSDKKNPTELSTAIPLWASLKVTC